MQCEAPFLDALQEPYRSQCWETLGERQRDVAHFMPVSAFTGGLMGARMGLSSERWSVVPNGIRHEDFSAGQRASQAPTIGYLARMCPDKGLPTLVDAFLELRARIPGLRLLAGGVLLRVDQGMLHELKQRIRRAGATDAVEFRPNMTRAQKLALLGDCDVFGVPATYGESFGLYLIEAMASGLPVVQPRCGGFPELIEATRGGLLCEPDDPSSLAAGLGELLGDLPAARRMGQRGQQAVRADYGREHMAARVVRIAQASIAQGPT